MNAPINIIFINIIIIIVCCSGLQKLGVSVALINFNLRSKLLSHSVLAAEPVALIVGAGQSIFLFGSVSYIEQFNLSTKEA